MHSLVVDLDDADWTLVGVDNGDWTGYFASPAGDVNNDGLGDILIGAPMAGDKVCPLPLDPQGNCPGIPKGKGVSYLVLGREGQLPDPMNLAEADASFLGCETNSMTGRQLYTAGDVNGDGFDDFLISGWKCGENYTGKAYLFLGRSNVASWGQLFSVEEADASFLGENQKDFLSYYVATAGDVNGDGYDDFLITSTHHEYDDLCPPGTIGCPRCCKSFNTSAEIYSPLENTWSLTGGLNVERTNFMAVRLGDQVLIAGGQNGNYYLDSAEIYDPTTGVWEMTGSLSMARTEHSMVVLGDGKAIVSGGMNLSGFLASSEIFDLSNGSWTETGDLNLARSAHTATLITGGKILVAGGQNGSGYLDSTEVYDPDTGLWSMSGSLNTPRSGHTSTLLTDGKVLVAGGQDENGFIASAELYDPVTGEWSSTGSLNDARRYHTATLLPDGKVLVSGGRGSSGYLYSAEIFDPSTGFWVYTSSMETDRANHTASTLSDGRLLVAGGQNLDGSNAGFEIYDVAEAGWTSVISNTLNITRAGHVAIALADGKVLVAGGSNCNDFGKVYLILGREEADWGTDFDLRQADASFLGEAVEDRLGRSVAGVGDVNDDGYDDFLIGSISSDYTAKDAGQNYLFLGRASPDDPGYDPNRPWWGNDYLASGADASFVGEAEGDESGRRVAWVGDVNGDGLDDMLMQAALNDHAAPDAGISYLVLGRRAADWGMHYPLANADASFVGEEKADQAGRRLSGAGDVNHDGYDDILIGAPHNQDGSEYQGIIAGKAYIIFGKPNVDWGLYFPLALADIIYIGKPEVGVAGYDIAWLKDVNRDGIDDFLIAAYGGRNNTHNPGEVYVMFGSETPVPAQFTSEIVTLEDHPLLRYIGDYWEPNGWNDLNIVYLDLEEIGGSLALKLKYDRINNWMYLYDDLSNAWLGPCVPEENGQLETVFARLDCKASKVINDQNHTMRVAWRVHWLIDNLKAKSFDVYLQAVDLSGNDSGPAYFGIWKLLPHKIYLPTIR
jgi:N-acetylneuraminic acid mutarotase